MPFTTAVHNVFLCFFFSVKNNAWLSMLIISYRRLFSEKNKKRIIHFAYTNFVFNRLTEWPFLGRLFTNKPKYTFTKIFLKVVVHVIIIVQWNQTSRLYEIQVTIIYSHTSLVAVTAECSLKRFINKTWTGTLANSADPDQMLQNAASDQGLHCLLKLQEVKR